MGLVTYPRLRLAMAGMGAIYATLPDSFDRSIGIDTTVSNHENGVVRSTDR
jgi:hypothetical protein